MLTIIWAFEFIKTIMKVLDGVFLQGIPSKFKCHELKIHGFMACPLLPGRCPLPSSASNSAFFIYFKNTPLMHTFLSTVSGVLLSQLWSFCLGHCNRLLPGILRPTFVLCPFFQRSSWIPGWKCKSMFLPPQLKTLQPFPCAFRRVSSIRVWVGEFPKIILYCYVIIIAFVAFVKVCNHLFICCIFLVTHYCLSLCYVVSAKTSGNLSI